jgi:hypothetical protein
MIRRHEATAARYRTGAELARKGWLLTDAEHRQDARWWTQFSLLFARAHRESPAVNPDEPQVDLDFYKR